MFKNYLKIFLKQFLLSAIFPFLIFLGIGGEPSASLIITVVVVLLLVASYSTHTEIVKEINKKTVAEIQSLNVKYGDVKKQIEQVNMFAQQQIERTNIDAQQQIERTNIDVQQQIKKAVSSENLWKQTLLERTSGFPSLIKRIQEYEEVRDEQLSHFLDIKKHPAYKAADLVRVEASRRREAEFIRKRTEAIIEYYEYLAPFLLDVKDDVSVDLDQGEIFDDYTEEEQEDPVIKYLTKEEYRKLPSFERNQLALDRFWKRPKSNWLVGKLYERYIGYLYEKDGYNIEYHGIQKKLEDLGIDLICRKGNETMLVQCKNWAKFKTIYEKHVFQLFGTTFQFRDSHPEQKVKATFATTIQLSPIARKFANELGIELKENLRFDQGYPCIKCNISMTTSEKIYHLPFDQQYDKTKISREGEMYCLTTKEAEDAGFRRAFRWHGNGESNI